MIWNWDKLNRQEKRLLVELIAVAALGAIGFIYSVFVIATTAALVGIGEALYQMGWALVLFPMLSIGLVFVIGLADYYMR